MPVSVESSLKTLGYVVTVAKPRSRHRLCRHPAAPAGPAYKKHVIIRAQTRRLERSIDAVCKLWIDLTARERLPFDRHNLAPKARQVWNTNERPLGSRSHIDKRSSRISFQLFPHATDWNVLDMDKLNFVHERPQRTLKQTSCCQRSVERR